MVLSIKKINWNELKQDILKQESFVDDKGDVHKQICLGRVSNLTPSGKHRTFGRPGRDWTSPGGYVGYAKVRDLAIIEEERRDFQWWRKLLAEAKRHGIYIRPSDDKHRTFIMAGIKVKDRSET